MPEPSSDKETILAMLDRLGVSSEAESKAKTGVRRGLESERDKDRIIVALHGYYADCFFVFDNDGKLIFIDLNG